MKKNVFRIVALVVVFVMAFTSPAFSGVALAQNSDPIVRNSDYIDNYCAYLYSPSSGQVQVWFELKANRTSDKVGATSIVLQVSDDLKTWTNVQTFKYWDYPDMMASDTISNTTYVETSVESGHYYRASVTLYVERAGGSDSRFYTTDPVWI